MDERRDPQPGDESPRRPVAAAVTLPPVQQAWSRYATHTLACPACRDIDQRCEESGRLYRAWQAQADAAYRRLRAETA
ncbi:hypothetical protein ACJ6WF_16795 [Streptomyces sp. MMS24-I2-30]|uniref:hypothetical protein n=1 Tax=Streptomyces sp. MMS24-I2-30 TaxID=3351564 RepID=UPI0038969A35